MSGNITVPWPWVIDGGTLLLTDATHTVYILLANPENTAADATITYLREGKPPLLQTYTGGSNALGMPIP